MAGPISHCFQFVMIVSNISLTCLSNYLHLIIITRKTVRDHLKIIGVYFNSNDIQQLCQKGKKKKDLLKV